MTIQYCVFGKDNDSYAFREYPALTANQKIHQTVAPDMSGTCRAELRRCESCGELLDKWNESLEGLILKKRKLDIGYTYDGVAVVSERFRTAYDVNALSGLTFRQLPDDPLFFAIRPERAVEFDGGRRGTRFINSCSKCGCYESVVGATPIYLKPNAEIGLREFVRTDLEFGSNDEKSPLLLCGESAAETLQAARLKGLELERVNGSSA